MSVPATACWLLSAFSWLLTFEYSDSYHTLVQWELPIALVSWLGWIPALFIPTSDWSFTSWCMAYVDEIIVVCTCHCYVARCSQVQTINQLLLLFNVKTVRVGSFHGSSRQLHIFIGCLLASWCSGHGSLDLSSDAGTVYSATCFCCSCDLCPTCGSSNS